MHFDNSVLIIGIIGIACVVLDVILRLGPGISLLGPLNFVGSKARSNKEMVADRMIAHRLAATNESLPRHTRHNNWFTWAAYVIKGAGTDQTALELDQVLGTSPTTNVTAIAPAAPQVAATGGGAPI